MGAADYGTSIRKRYAELADLVDKPEEQAKAEPEDTRSAKEIATDIWTRIRGQKNQEH